METGRIYREIAREMARFADSIPRFKLIRFEDILNKPFDVAEELYEFAEVSPVATDYLRLKSKKVVDEQGEHKVSHGDEERKYWFTRETIDQILKPGIDQTQMDRLSKESVRDFEREARPALEYLGYARSPESERSAQL